MSVIASSAHDPDGQPSRLPGAGPGAIPAEALQIVSYDRAPGAVVVLTGELDIASLPVLTGHLARPESAGRVHLVAELSGLRFCDCAGLAGLLRIHRRAAEHCGWLRLCAATASMDKLLRITKLSQVLLCYPTLDEAFADVAAAPVEQPTPPM